MAAERRSTATQYVSFHLVIDATCDLLADGSKKGHSQPERQLGEKYEPIVSSARYVYQSGARGERELRVSSQTNFKSTGKIGDELGLP